MTVPEKRSMEWVEFSSAPVRNDPATATVRGRNCWTKAGLLAEWAQSLNFPDYFGHDWDAFHDCLLDQALSHAEEQLAAPVARPLTVLVEDAGQLLAQAPDRDLAAFLRLVRDAATVPGGDEDAGRHPAAETEAAAQTEAGPWIRLVLHDTPEELRDLAQRMRAAGFSGAGPRGPAGTV